MAFIPENIKASVLPICPEDQDGHCKFTREILMSAKSPGNGAVSFHLPKRLGALWRDEKGYRSRGGKCRRVIRDLVGPSVTAVTGSSMFPKLCVSMFPKLWQHLVSKEEKGGFLCLLDLGDGNVVLIYSSQVFPNCTQHWFFFFSNFSSLFDPKQLGEGNLVGIIQAPCADPSLYNSSYLTVFTFFFFFNWTIFALQYS